MDADVIKTYVQLGMGVGIVASIAVRRRARPQLRALDARHLFEHQRDTLAVRRGTWLRGYVHAFIESFAPTLTREVVEQALASDSAVRDEV
jgi:LysR family cys regulon transcriptional activator